MAIEEHEFTETNLDELIERLEQDDIPTNIFTVEDTDPMVLLGKLNEVIANLQTISDTVTSSDTKADEAIAKATQAIADATEALTTANGIDAKATQALANAIEAVASANTAVQASTQAVSSANTALSTANTAISTANSAEDTAQSAENKADNAVTTANTANTTANSAKTTAEGIDTKATQALTNSQTAITTANNASVTATSADTKADTAISTANSADTKADTAISTANTANTNASNAVSTANSASSTANTASQNASTALTTAQTASQNASTALSTANNADSKADSAVATAEDALEQVVAGLGTKVYRDTTLLSTLDIKPIEDDIAQNTSDISNKVDKVTGKGLSTEDFTTALLTKLNGIANEANKTTTINGLSGGSLTSPLVIKGGDAVTAGKIALDQTASGQITNNATQTLFGFTSNNATTLTIGHSSYAMALRGSGTRPKYNSNDLGMFSDIPTKTSQLTNDSGYLTRHQDISGKLNKAGDTMTGNLDITSGKYIRFLGNANLNENTNYSMLTSNSTSQYFGTVNKTTYLSSSSASIKCRVNGDPNTTLDMIHQKYKSNATNTATSGNFIGNYDSCIEFSNGLKICWGSRGSSDTNNQSVTFLNGGFTYLPTVSLSMYWESGTREIVVRNLTKTGCNLVANGNVRSFMYIAIGIKN